MKRLLMVFGILGTVVLLSSCDTAYIAVDDNVPYTTYYWWPTYGHHYIYGAPAIRPQIRSYRPPKARPMPPRQKNVMPPRR